MSGEFLISTPADKRAFRKHRFYLQDPGNCRLAVIPVRNFWLSNWKIQSTNQDAQALVINV